jgi:hypothetical protein
VNDEKRFNFVSKVNIMDTYLSIEEIKKHFPNEWVLLGNPTTTDLDVLGGIVLFHSADKKEVFVAGKEKIKFYALSTLVFAGDLKPMRRLGILRKL